jgi:hypothetical protein
MPARTARVAGRGQWTGSEPDSALSVWEFMDGPCSKLRVAVRPLTSDRGTLVGAFDSLLLLRGEVARQRLSIRARMTIMVSERGRDMASG